MPIPTVSVTVRFLHLLQRDDGFEEGVPREVGAGSFRISQPPARQHRIEGLVELSTDRLLSNLHRVTLRVKNLTASDDHIGRARLHPRHRCISPTAPLSP